MARREADSETAGARSVPFRTNNAPLSHPPTLSPSHARLRSPLNKLLAALLTVFCALSARAGTPDKPATADGAGVFGGATDYDDVVLTLAAQLPKDPAAALDAANKLGQLGRRAVPVLSELLKRSTNDQVKYYSTLALSRIRHPSGAEALLPLLTDEKAPRELRLLAIEAASGSWLEAAVEPLKKIASQADDDQLRQKALESLSVMPTAWPRCEDLFVGLLDSADDARRSLGVQACLYAAAKNIVYASGETKLLTLAENDASSTLRARALQTLARMKSGRVVPLLIRILAQPDAAPGTAKLALAACEQVTGVPLRDAAAAQTWWEKYGQARYANAPPLELPAARKSDAATKRPAAPPKETPPAPPPKPSAEVTPSPPAPPPAVPGATAKAEPKLELVPDDEPTLKPYTGIPMGN